ncbi:MAG TPA: DUF1329 domain-containing protein [Nevskiaceae bacterium]|nr:DUF1329 domain-containing protein [Nevskiaceae bacterium]
MKSRQWLLSLTVALATAATAPLATAKVTAEKAKELDGPKLTCMGAEKAGTPSGVAEWTGKYNGTWPGQTKPHGYEPGPYKDEKPLFTITKANMAQYADKLTEGQKALLNKYAEYKMNVYPSHRDFRFDDWVCDRVKKNAVEAEVNPNGLGLKGNAGAHPFPFPASGIEAVWNIINPHRATTEKAVCDIADVYANGQIAWGRNVFKTLNPGNDKKNNGKYSDQYNAFFYTGYLLPERDKGFVAVGFQPNDFTSATTSSWQYQPGIRRVRQAPEVGFDYPVPPAGLRNVDDDYVFNGSPERYTWKLIGKKEFYVPYHNFKTQDPALKYTQLLGKNTVNPEFQRYELHRVWVVEGNLKEGVRHIYKRRVLYADEDTWIALWADNYDGRGQMWRTAWVDYFYSQESHAFHRAMSIYQDLQKDAYEAGYMVNERGPDNWWRLNTPMTQAEFSPEAAARGGR